MRRVNCLGILVTDALCGPLRRYPHPRLCPQVNARSIRFLPGGGAVNSAAALAQIGISVGLFSKIGADANGAAALEYLAGLGVDVGGVARSASETTPFTFVGIHPRGERTFVHTPGCNLTFSPADVDLDSLMEADVLLAQDLWALPALAGKPLAGVLAEARRRGVITVLDECWGYGPRRRSLEVVLPHADYVLPSHTDLQAIYPKLSPEDIIRRLQERGATNVVLKTGPKGCLFDVGHGLGWRPSVADTIVDPTGAGDCFDAGFIAGLVRGLSAEQAVDIALQAAAACLRQVGGAVGIPRFEELRAGRAGGAAARTPRAEG
jgi:sugar/nucleoside kinase (ribokinase family)